MKSNWELLRQRSQYHFDTAVIDPRWDTIISVGHIQPCWQQELEQVLASAHSVTWRTRGRDNDPLKRNAQEYDQEDYDLEQQGYGRDHIVTDLEYRVPMTLQNIADQFALDQVMVRVHVQRPGQVWNLHLDKLEKWMPSDPTRVVRYFIQLTDWQPGHFWSYGNYVYQGWHAGDVTTFDWLNVPHATANAGHVPRATLQITGIETAGHVKFLNTLK
jgi:hypothetical protein